MRWIVGDIHGMSAVLKALIAAVNDVDAKPAWIFVGDYVNRGADSRGVVDTLLNLPNARFGRGNHDDIFDVMVNQQSYVESLTNNNRGRAFKWFSEHGLLDTLASYGADPLIVQAMLERPSIAGLDALVAKVPASHRKFFRNLSAVIEEPDLFVIHARWEPTTPDEDPSLTTYLDVDQELRKTATWGRFSIGEVDAPKAWRRRGFFGHTPVDTYGTRGGFSSRGGGALVPVIGNKMVLLDTAAALSPVGRLTAYNADTDKFLQVDRAGQIYSST